jgi:hypothetical protein
LTPDAGDPSLGTQAEKGGLWGPPFLPFPGLLQQPRLRRASLFDVACLLSPAADMPPIRSAPLWAITRLPLQRSDVSFPQVRTWSAAARRIHPVLNSIPMLDEDSIVRRAVSISIDGMMEPITLDHTGRPSGSSARRAQRRAPWRCFAGGRSRGGHRHGNVVSSAAAGSDRRSGCRGPDIARPGAGPGHG